MIKRYLAGLGLSLLSTQVLAHFPILDCHAEQQQLVCQAGFSDGSVAHKEVVEVRDYQETLLQKVTTDTSGIIRMPMPEGEFYLVYNPGHEQPAEFDYVEL